MYPWPRESSSSPGDHENRQRLTPDTLLLDLSLQIVIDVERSGDAVRTHKRGGAVQIIENNAFQPHIPVFHDDMDRRQRLKTVPRGKRRIAINRLIYPPAQLVVRSRKRQHFNVVDYVSNAFNFLDRLFRIFFQHRLGYLSKQSHSASIDVERQV